MKCGTPARSDHRSRERPTLSIAMCTCNSAAYVHDQLESYAAQTRLPDELVICDDRSDDSSLDIARAFAARAPFSVRVHANPVRVGIVANFEQAIRLCTSDLILLSDADNYSLPQHLTVLESVMARAGVGLAFCDALIADKDLQPTGERLWQVLGLAAHLKQIEGPFGADALLPGWFISGACMAFRASLRSVVLPIPTDLPLLHDGWIAAVAAGVAPVAGVTEPLLMFREHAAQQCGVGRKPQHEGGFDISEALRRRHSFDAEIRIAERIYERLSMQRSFPLRPGVRERLYSRLTHLRARATLPTHALRRVLPVMQELVTGRYHRYANGVLSAAKDLVLRTSA